MKIENDRLKQLYQGYIDSKIPGDRKRCPSPRLLHKTIKPSGSFRNKKKFIDHISKCSYCKNEFILLLKLNNYEAQLPSNQIITSRKSCSLVNPLYLVPPPRLLINYASILISTILIIFSLFLIQKKEFSLAGQRRNSQMIQLINPLNVHILPNKLTFKWGEYPEAQYYILEVFDNTLLPLWTSPRITKLVFHLPDKILAELKKNSYYFWMITAFSGTEKVAESDLASFFTIIN